MNLIERALLIVPDKYMVSVKQLIKYGMVGVINLIISTSFALLLQNVFEISVEIANAIGIFTVGFTINFFINRSWTFKSNNSIGRDGLYSIGVYLFSYTMQFMVLEYILQNDILSKNLAQITANCTMAFFNFTLSKFVTYRKNPENAPAEEAPIEK